MIRPIVLLAADTVIRDSDDGQMSVINIFEQFKVPGFPVVLPRFTIFCALARDEGDESEPEVIIKVHLGESELFTQSMPVNFGDSLLNRIKLFFGGFALTGPGILKISVHVAGDELGEYSIPVKHRAMPIHSDEPGEDEE